MPLRTMYCGKCGKANKESSKFCQYCGQSLASSEATDSVQESVLSEHGRTSNADRIELVNKYWKNLWAIVISFLVLKYASRALASETGYIEWNYLQLFFTLGVPIALAYYAYRISGKTSEAVVNGLAGLIQILFLGPLAAYVRLKKVRRDKIIALDPSRKDDASLQVSSRLENFFSLNLNIKHLLVSLVWLFSVLAIIFFIFITFDAWSTGDNEAALQSLGISVLLGLIVWWTSKNILAHNRKVKMDKE